MYTDIFDRDPTGLSMGMPTVSPDAAIANVGTGTANTDLSAPSMVPSVNTVGPSKVGGFGGGMVKPGFFSEFGPAQFGLGAIQTLGSLWNSFEQNKLAKQSFNFQKEAYATNLANQTKTYNTELEDRINARYATEVRANAAEDAASYVEKNRL